MSETNSLKRKAFFDDITCNNSSKHVKYNSIILNNNTNNNYIADETNSVTLELDNTFSAPLLKQMLRKPTASKYIKYYEDEELREIIIQKPQFSIQFFGESLVEYVVSRLSIKEFNYFMRDCVNVNLAFQDKMEVFKQQAKNDETVMKLLKIIFNNLDKFIGTFKIERFSRLDSNDFKHLPRILIMKCVKHRGNILQFLSKSLKSDREIVLEAVRNDGRALKYASKELQSDEEIVKAAINQNGAALDFASDELKSKKSLKLLSLQSASYRTVPDSIIKCDDRELILQALKAYPCLFPQVRTEFKSDREIVYAVVKQYCGSLIQYASRELQMDRELLLLAINNNRSCNTIIIPYEFYSDREIVLAGISREEILFTRLPKELQNDKEIVIAGVKMGRVKLQDIPKEMLNDSAVVLEILKKGNQQNLLTILKDLKRAEKDWIVEFIK